MSSICGFITFTEEFPITNHKDVDAGNLGWIRGVFDDGLPFEAELWEYEESKNISVLIPSKNYEKSKTISVSLPSKDYDGITEKEGENIIPFHNSQGFVHGGVLAVGMVSLGCETDDETVYNLVYYLEEKGLINFVGDWRNGFVRYVVDKSGNIFSEIVVELELDENIFATVDVEWNEFISKKKKRDFTVVD